MREKLDVKRITIFLAFAFGIAWAFALIIYLSGGFTNSSELIPGTGITLAALLLLIGYMSAPAAAHILTRLVTREGWQDTFLRLQFKRGWPYWLAGWVVPALATVLGGALFFLLFPSTFDSSLSRIKDTLASTGQPAPISPWAVVVIQTGFAIAIAPLINGLLTFGEEFGWRAYLQPKLMPLGKRRALLAMGLIWGVWHWPVTAMGHNFGLDYVGAPWLGMLTMVWFTLACGTFLGWITLRGGSVWPAVIGHGAINGISSLAILFVQGKPHPLLGPLPVGLIGSAGWALVALWIYLHPRALAVPAPDAGASSGDIPTLPSSG